MLPIVDKPTIQYVVEEAVQSGITDILIITGRGKQSIEGYFDRAVELERRLEEKGRMEQLREVRELANLANIHFIRQRELNGLGDAISYARWHVGDEPFIVLLGDCMVDSRIPCARQMIDVFNRLQAPLLGVEVVPPEKLSRYGIIGGPQVETNVWRVDEMVEKPQHGEAPSNLAIGGRYVLTPDIFDCIDRTPRGVGNEIQLTDALRLLRREREIFAFKYSGVRYDIGSRLDYLKATVAYAAERDDLGSEFRGFLRDFVKEMKE
jgi:UTP--glucose-1-phosphate uridylyltransferase